MQKIWLAALLCSLCLPGSLLAEGPLPEGNVDLSSLTANVKVNPYAQVGFQWGGSSLNLPIEAERLLSPDFVLQIGDLDVSLRDANFWSGTAGFSIVAYKKYSLFATAGGIVGRQFVTSGTIPISLGLLGTTALIEFTNKNVESWFIQTGIGLGPVLAGLYWDYFGFEFGDPRNPSGLLPNQTLTGDILAKTFAPFAGLALPASGATLTIIYSPLAYSNTKLPLRNSQNTLTELRYSWNKPGDLINAMVQYNTPLNSSLSFGLWGG